MIKEVVGNLIAKAENGEFDLIAHGCNTFCTMGSGIAAAIRAKWPEAYDVDCETTKGDKTKLGTITYTKNVPNLTIVNCYTQHEYGRGVQVYADYDAIEKSLTEIKNVFPGKRIGLPWIGAGLARGDWNTIKAIIQKVFSDPSDDVTIVEFEENVKKKTNQGQNSILSQLSAFKSFGSSSNQQTSNHPTMSPASIATAAKKTRKPHGKRMCKVCHSKKPVKDMVNYIAAVWVCKEKCHDEFYGLVKIANDKLLSNTSIAVTPDPSNTTPAVVAN